MKGSNDSPDAGALYIVPDVWVALDAAAAAFLGACLVFLDAVLGTDQEGMPWEESQRQRQRDDLEVYPGSELAYRPSRGDSS